MERRKVAFVDGMSNDFLLIITDAPKEEIENYCVHHNMMMENGGHFEVFDALKTRYYVKELLDSEIDEKENLEIIGYDEIYDLSKNLEESMVVNEKAIIELSKKDKTYKDKFLSSVFRNCKKEYEDIKKLVDLDIPFDDYATEEVRSAINKGARCVDMRYAYGVTLKPDGVKILGALLDGYENWGLDPFFYTYDEVRETGLKTLVENALKDRPRGVTMDENGVPLTKFGFMQCMQVEDWKEFCAKEHEIDDLILSLKKGSYMIYSE